MDPGAIEPCTSQRNRGCNVGILGIAACGLVGCTLKEQHLAGKLVKIADVFSGRPLPGIRRLSGFVGDPPKASYSGRGKGIGARNGPGSQNKLRATPYCRPLKGLAKPLVRKDPNGNHQEIDATPEYFLAPLPDGTMTGAFRAKSGWSDKFVRRGYYPYAPSGNLSPNLLHSCFTHENGRDICRLPRFDPLQDLPGDSPVTDQHHVHKGVLLSTAGARRWSRERTSKRANTVHVDLDHRRSVHRQRLLQEPAQFPSLIDTPVRQAE